MHSITQVLMDGAHEGRCKKPKFFKGPGAQVNNMHRHDGISPKPPARAKFAARGMREYEMNKNRPKET